MDKPVLGALFGLLVFIIALTFIYLLAWGVAQWLGVGLGLVLDLLEEL